MFFSADRVPQIIQERQNRLIIRLIRIAVNGLHAPIQADADAGHDLPLDLFHAAVQRFDRLILFVFFENLRKIRRTFHAAREIFLQFFL